MVEVGRTKEREWRKNGRERCEEMAMKEEGKSSHRYT